jgi:hypothetical protein
LGKEIEGLEVIPIGEMGFDYGVPKECVFGTN